MKDQRADQREVDRIRERLDAGTPRNGDTIGRATSGSASGRSRRTRRGVVGGVAIVAVAATVIVGPHFISSSPITNEATELQSDVTPGGPPAEPAEPLANPCPDEPVDVADALAAVALPSDVVSVRLCQGIMRHLPRRNAEQDVISDWDPPADALVIGIGVFVDAVNESPWLDSPRCLRYLPSAHPFALRFTLSDGTVITLGSAYPPCVGFSLGGAGVPQQTLLSNFSQALSAQRQSLDPPPLGTNSLRCSDLELHGLEPDVLPPFIKPGADIDLSYAEVCRVQNPMTPGPKKRTGAGVLSAPDVAAINADVAQRSMIGGSLVGCTDNYSPLTFIVGLNAWGDQITLARTDCTEMYRYGSRSWTPSGSAARVIESALR